MKNIAIILIAITAMLLHGCSKDNGETSVFTQTVKVESIAIQFEQTLDGLSSAITGINQPEKSEEWLTVTAVKYSSERPRVTISVKENTEVTARRATAIITEDKGNRLHLTVEQKGKASDYIWTGVDDSHNVVTNQNAYSRRE